MNPDKAYIQVTFAEPYFDNYGEFTQHFLVLFADKMVNFCRN